MPKSIPFPRRLPGRLAAFELGLALVLALGWPLGVSGTESPAGDLRTVPLGDGLEQVVADGVGHRFDRRPVRDLAIAGDGTVWAIQGRRVVELGRPGSVAPRSQRWGHALRRLEVQPDGTLWALEDGGTVTRLVDGALEDRSQDLRDTGVSLAALPDGQLWRTVRVPDRQASVVTTIDGTSWEELPGQELEELLAPGDARHTFAQTTDGRVWLGVDRGPRGGGLAVLGDLGWTVVAGDPTEDGLRIRALEPADDGSLWALADIGAPGTDARHALVRVTGDQLEMLGQAEGMPQDASLAWTGWSPLEPSALAVDGSGRVWFSVGDSGLWRYDGVGFERVDVPGLTPGALDLERAPDDSIWIVGRSGGLYRADEAPDP
jgi:hypothetical protein